MGRAGNAGTQFVDEQAHGSGVTRQVVAQGFAREVAGTTQADDARTDDTGEVMEAVDAVLSALAEGRERQTVVVGVAATENDAGTIVEAHVGSANLGNRCLADDMIGRFERRQLVGHVNLMPVTVDGLLTIGRDEQTQVVLIGNLLLHLIAATQQEVLGARLEGLLYELQQRQRVDGGQETLHEPQLLVAGDEAVALVVVGINFVHQTDGAYVTAGIRHLVTHGAEHGLLGTGNLRLREAITENLLLMGNEVGNTLAQTALGQFDRGIGNACSTKEARVLDTARGIGGIVERQGGKARLHQTIDKTALQVLAVVVGGLYGRRLRQQHEHIELGGLNARSRGDGDCFGGIFGNDWDFGGDALSGMSGQSAKLLANHLLHLVDINIANNSQCHELRTVPLLIVVADGLGRGMTDDGGIANSDTAVVDGAVEQLTDKAHGIVGLRAATRQPLRQDDATLLLHLGRVDGKTTGPVGEDGQRGVDQQGVGTRQLQFVDGLVERRVGVEVLTELGATRL